jgi:threonine dehydrogenase-like Zn-dependent dehydrogenase
VFAIDCVPSRLEKAREQGAEIINFEEMHPVEFIHEMTGGIGVDRVIDAVGVDARHARHRPAKKDYDKRKQEIEEQVRQIAPKTNPQGKLWQPGDAPSQALEWAIKSLDKAGTLSIIGVYPETDHYFPIGQAANRNLEIRMGNCPHRRYIPRLLRMVRSGEIDPVSILSNVEPLPSAIEAYKKFDQQADGWMKVALVA